MGAQEKDPLVEMLMAVFGNYKAASISKMARIWFGKKPPATKVNELIPLLIEKIKLLNKEEVERVGKLSDLQRVALIIASRKKTFLTLVSLVQSEGYLNVKEGLYELACKGFLLVDNGDSYSKVDFSSAQPGGCFLDFEVSTLPALRTMFSAPSSVKEVFDDIPENNIGKTFVSHAHEFLEALERLSSLLLKKKIQLTKKGMVRSNQTTIVEREVVLSGGWGMASMVLATALSSSRVIVENGVLRPNLDWTHNKVSVADTLKYLFLFFLKASWADDTDEKNDDPIAMFFPEYQTPIGQGIVDGRCLLVKILGRLKNRGWVSLDEFTDRVLGLSSNFLFTANFRYDYYRNVDKRGVYEQAVQREFVRCFLGRTSSRFGLVETALINGATELKEYKRPLREDYHDYRNHDSDDRRLEWKPEPSNMAFRLTELGASVLCGDRFKADSEHKPSLQVGADFEIIAPVSQTSPDVYIMLSKCSTPISGHASDPVRRFKLERESIHGALRLGQSLEEIISFLEKYSTHPLPPNVSRTLKDWANLFGRIKVLRGLDLFEFETSEKREMYIKQHPGMDKIGECFALSPAKPLGKIGLTLLDYDAPPAACITISADVKLCFDKNKIDLILESEISKYAVPVQEGVYEITNESVSSSPLTHEEIISHLKVRSLGSIPADLISSVYGWANAIKPVPVDTVCLMQIDSKILRRGIDARKGMKKYILGQLSPSLFLVNKKTLKKLKAEFLKMGVDTNDSLLIPPVSNSKTLGKAKASKGLSLEGLLSFSAKQTKTLLEKAIENKHEVEIFFLSASRFSTEKVLYKVMPKDIERYSNRPVLLADYRDAEYGEKSSIRIYVKDILALRVIDEG